MARRSSVKRLKPLGGPRQVDPEPIRTLSLSEWLHFLRTGKPVPQELVQDLNLPTPGERPSIDATLALIASDVHPVDRERLEAEIREKGPDNESLEKTLCLAGGLIPLDAEDANFFRTRVMSDWRYMSPDRGLDSVEPEPTYPEGVIPKGAWDLYLRPPVQSTEAELEQDLRQMRREVDADDVE